MSEVKYAIALVKQKLANADKRDASFQGFSIAEMEAIWGVLAKAEADYAALQQKLDAAKTKLAEMEKQEPVAWADLQHLKKYGYCAAFEDKLHVMGERAKLFTRPAPAINMAELVPGEMTNPHQIAAEGTGWNDCRAAILRNIEEDK